MSSRPLSSSGFKHYNYVYVSGEKHNCQDEQCNADKLSAPLYLYIQMQLCQQESLKDWLKANHERDHGYCLNVFEEVSFYLRNEHITGIVLSFVLLKQTKIWFKMLSFILSIIWCTCEAKPLD